MSKSNVVFLDYDGVVNTPMWSPDGKRCSFGFPSDNKVNNFQCVQWVSEFCQKYGYSIVVSSTWRFDSNYKECLVNGGLRDGIEILGRTPHLSGENREAEIQQYLSDHPEITSFLIFDDDTDMGDLIDHLVECNPNIGFGITELNKAGRLHEKFKNAAVASEKKRS